MRGRRSKQHVALLLETSYFLAYSFRVERREKVGGTETSNPVYRCEDSPPLPGINRWMVSEVIIVRLGKS